MCMNLRMRWVFPAQHPVPFIDRIQILDRGFRLENGTAFLCIPLLAYGPEIPLFAGDFAWTAAKRLNLLKRFGASTLGKLPERIHYLGNVLAAWATMRAGRVHG